MQGSTKAEVHDTFVDRLSDLMAKSAQIAAAFLTGGNRPWMVPPGLAARDLLDVPSLHNPDWDRDDINDNYDEAVADLNDPGTVGDVLSLKFQADYAAAEERAFRLRHATYVRCMTHVHGRRSAHGNQAGVFDAPRRQAAMLITAGGISQEADTSEEDETE